MVLLLTLIFLFERRNKLNKVTLYCFAKLLSGEYDLPQKLPLRQKRQWLQSLSWFLTPAVCGFQGILRHAGHFWRWLLYAPSHQEYPEIETLLGFLSDIAQGKRPLFDNKEYPSPDTFSSLPKASIEGRIQGVNQNRTEPLF